jgi:glycosyltransferase involved in cell wall biosynthesis
MPSASRPNIQRPTIIRLIPVLDFGGVETTFALEAERINRDQFDFRVCTFWKAGAAAQRIRNVGIPVDVLYVDPSVRNPMATWALIKYLRRTRPDIVHASIGEANFHAALARRPSGGPITIMEEQGLPDRRLPSRLVHATLYRMVDAVVGVSTITCDYLVQREWASRSKVHLIYNAVADRFLSTPLPVKARDGRFRFLSVGRLVDVKNHSTLIRAFADIAAEAPRADLTIIGDGELMGDLRGLAAQLGIADRVHLPGFHDDILSKLDEYDCFLLPSLSEGFGIAAVEAMARGLPIIASDAGALPEVVGPLGTDWILSATDRPAWAHRMRDVATMDDESLVRTSRDAQAIAGLYSEQRHVQAVEKLYHDLIHRKGKVGK